MRLDSSSADTGSMLPSLVHCVTRRAAGQQGRIRSCGWHSPDGNLTGLSADPSIGMKQRLQQFSIGSAGKKSPFRLVSSKGRNLTHDEIKGHLESAIVSGLIAVVLSSVAGCGEANGPKISWSSPSQGDEVFGIARLKVKANSGEQRLRGQVLL